MNAIGTGASGGSVSPMPGPNTANQWTDWSVGGGAPGTGGSYDGDPSQAPTPYYNPSAGQYGGAPLPTPSGPPTINGMTPMLAPFAQATDVPYDRTKGWLNDPTNPNLNSGDITHINRSGPGFMGNGYYINDPAAYRMPQADAIRNAYQQSLAAQGNDASQWRGEQQGLVGSLNGTIAGNAPSVAQEQLKQTTQSNVANAYAMAAAHGSNPAAWKQAADNAASINQQATGQGALLRAQEIQGAQGMLGGVLSSGRAGDASNVAAQNQTMAGITGVDQAILNANENLQSQQQNAFYGTAGHSIGSQMIGGITTAASAAAGALAHGGLIDGKAQVKGDSSRNDTVHAMLSPGEVVLPRSVVTAKDAPKKAAAFLAAIKEKHARKRVAA